MQALIGWDLYGNKLTSEGRMDKLNQGLQASADALMEYAFFATVQAGSGSLPYGSYQKAPYHNAGNPVKSAAPINGQAALDNSVSIGSTTARRIGVSDGQIVVLDQTSSGIYHGHVRNWGDLTQQMKNALMKAGMVTRKGKIR